MIAALVLGGGRATRLGGTDKAAIVVDGRPLVEHVYAALDGAVVIAVGPDSLARPGVRVVREDPPFGGPVAALAAGLAALAPSVDEVLVLACDLPRADGIVAQLSAATFPDDADAVLLRDAGGRTQWLAGRYRVAALRRAVAAVARVDGAAMRQVAASLRIVAVDDDREASIDLDTWPEVESYRGERG